MGPYNDEGEVHIRTSLDHINKINMNEVDVTVQKDVL